MTRTAASLPTTNTEAPSSGRPHVTTSARAGDRRVGLLGTLVIVAVRVLGLSGAGTWALVQTILAAENISAVDDAARFAGQPVEGPLTAYCEADIIATHSMALSAGKTDAESPVLRLAGHRLWRSHGSRQADLGAEVGLDRFLARADEEPEMLAPVRYSDEQRHAFYSEQRPPGIVDKVAFSDRQADIDPCDCSGRPARSFAPDNAIDSVWRVGSAPAQRGWPA